MFGLGKCMGHFVDTQKTEGCMLSVIGTCNAPAIYGQPSLEYTLLSRLTSQAGPMTTWGVPCDFIVGTGSYNSLQTALLQGL